MLIVNDRLRLSSGYFSEAFLGYYISDTTGEKQEVIVKKVTPRIVMNQLANELGNKHSGRNKKSIRVSRIDFEHKNNELNQILEREGSVVRNLSHRNLVRMIEFARCKGDNVIVYEYADCGTLEERIERGHPINIIEWLDLLDQLTTGLAYMHSQSVYGSLIHMDICPANVLITSNEVYKIADFGLTESASVLLLNQSMGVHHKKYTNAMYAAPEVQANQPISQAADMWSLGLTLFRALTGLPVTIKGQHFNEIANSTAGLRKVRNHVSRSVSQHLRDQDQQIKKEVLALFHKLLSKADGSRFQNGSELAGFLQKLRHGRKSAFGRYLDRLDRFRVRLGKVLQIKEKSDQQRRALHQVLNSDKSEKAKLSGVAGLLSQQKELTELVLLEMGKASRAASLGFQKRGELPGPYWSECYDYFVGSTFFDTASSHFDALRYTMNLLAGDSPKSISRSEMERTVKALGCEAYELFRDTLRFLGRVSKRNPFAGSNAFKFFSSHFAVIWMDTRIGSDQLKLMKALDSCSRLLSEYSEFTLQRPSFKHVFHLEELFRQLTEVNTGFQRMFDVLLELLDRDDLSDEDRERELNKRLGHILGIDFSNDEETRAFYEGMQRIYKNQTSFTAKKSKLFRSMFESLYA